MLQWHPVKLALLCTFLLINWTTPSSGELMSDLPGKVEDPNSVEQIPKTPQKAAVFALEQTLAEVHLADDGQKISACRLYEIESSVEGNKVISSLKLPKVPVSLPEMLSVIEQCKTFASNDSDSQEEGDNASADDDVRTRRNVTTDAPVTKKPWTIWAGILPGTKWCGMGDIAEGYEQLGVRRELDRCCRAHDHCPVKLKAFRSGWGLVNFSLYTKSHCDCDENFYNCLKEANSQMSNILGNFYFNIMKLQCMKPTRTMVCSEKIVPLNEKSKCIRWKYASHTPKMSFTDPEKRY